MKELEKIIQYLDGDMKGDERQVFELETDSNPILAQQLRIAQQVDQLIADHELISFIDNLKLAKEQFKNEEFKEQNLTLAKSNDRLKKVFLMNNKIMAVASIVVVIAITLSAIIYSLLPHPSNDHIFSQYYHKYEADIITRSTVITDVNALVSAIQQYDKGNYNVAITKFGDILKLDPDNTAAHFFIGVSYIETSDYENAIKNFSVVIAQNDTAFIEHAEWYLALCYIKTKQVSKANTLLTKIVSRQTFYKIMAADVLKKLK